MANGEPIRRERSGGQQTSAGEPAGPPGAESDLIQRCQRGDRAAFETLYRRHVERVWRYGWGRTHSREAACEIVQETFLRMLRSIDRFAGHSSLATWLFTITRSVAIDHMRRARRRGAERENTEVFRLVQPADPPGCASDEQRRQAVREAVANLPRAYREAIVLYELSGLTVRETAKVLNWTESRVKVTLFRARRKLRDRLRGYVTGDSRACDEKQR